MNINSSYLWTPIHLTQIGLTSTRSSHKVGYMWSSISLNFKNCLDPFYAFTNFKTAIEFNIK